MIIQKDDLKTRLVALGKKQTDIILILRKRYREKISAPELSRIINSINDDAKANRICREIDIILSEWESERADPT